MIALPLSENDLLKVREIHEKFYKQEFSFPDFTKNFLCAFKIVENSKIICAGGIRPIMESILITDKDVDIHSRMLALLEVLSVSKYIAKKDGFNQLHAFVQDPNWELYLRKAGFHTCKGNALYLNL